MRQILKHINIMLTFNHINDILKLKQENLQKGYSFPANFHLCNIMIKCKNIFDVAFKIHLAQKCTQYSAEHVQNVRKQTDGVFTCLG